MQKRNVLLLGARGFLGSTIMQAAASLEQIELIGTARHYGGSVHAAIDVMNAEAVAQTIDHVKPDIVIWTLMDRERDMDLIDTGLKHVLESMEERTKLVYISSDAVFSAGRGNFSESDVPPWPISASGGIAEYAKAKLKGERMIRERHDRHVIVRIGPLYGTAGNRQIEARTVKMMERLDRGEQPIEAAINLVKTFVHVEDAARAILELCTNGYKGTIHLGPAAQESYYTFFQKRLRQLGLNPDAIVPAVVDHGGLAEDATLDTGLARSLLTTHFRKLEG